MTSRSELRSNRSKHGPAVREVVHREHDRDVEHLAEEHVDVVRRDALRRRLVDHRRGGRRVRVEDALRGAGRPAGVEDEERVVAADRARGRGLVGGGRREQVLVRRALSRSNVEPVVEVVPRLQLCHVVGELAVPEERTRLAVGEDPGLLGRGEAPVERLRDETRLGAREERLHHLGRVRREDRDAVAALEPEPVDEAVGQPVRALVERGERETAAVRDVDDRVAAGRPPRVARREVADVRAGTRRDAHRIPRAASATSAL
jgi:hypothetical protein